MIGAARLELGTFPTPFTPCPVLGSQLGVADLWIKRDDLTGFSWSGNKVRTIEYLLGDAIVQAADTVIVSGGPTSNFAALMAVACAKHDIQMHQVSYGTPPETDPTALAVGRAAGATLHFTGSLERASMEEVAEKHAQALRGARRRPYLVPRGGATTVGALGYAHAAGEFLCQLDQVGCDAVTIVIPVGSGGSIAGLLAGLTYQFAPIHLTRAIDVEVVGVSVSRSPENLRDSIAAKAEACGAGLPKLRSVSCRWSLTDGRGVGFACHDEHEATQMDALMLRTGLLVDPTYNGKAMLWLRRSPVKPDGPVVYWHTGGALGVADQLRKAAAKQRRLQP
ncbi:pyridoxal-phosphate dependent enzyme [Ensifer sp. ENS07]|uniref:1-aminocyclopropane-1-carboxylate deaminase/D-cysteine desulfhydrase n=1 Tax=unclassified Ensifer TaxID=2633371 RepID=UPI0017875589|nr:pyridoxal-phosphate dependent enzyme [Ensifer sp. ENS10]MBD9637416.1 pyridoxal-phosphate dependent enzyme [Ensifer sp. ENS07]